MAAAAAGAEEGKEGWRLRRRCCMMLDGNNPCAPPAVVSIIDGKVMDAMEVRCASMSCRKGRLYILGRVLTAGARRE